VGLLLFWREISVRPWNLAWTAHVFILLHHLMNISIHTNFHPTPMMFLGGKSRHKYLYMILHTHLPLGMGVLNNPVALLN
jgi:hypothetical protein